MSTSPSSLLPDRLREPLQSLPKCHHTLNFAPILKTFSHFVHLRRVRFPCPLRFRTSTLSPLPRKHLKVSSLRVLGFYSRPTPSSSTFTFSLVSPYTDVRYPGWPVSSNTTGDYFWTPSGGRVSQSTLTGTSGRSMSLPEEFRVLDWDTTRVWGLLVWLRDPGIGELLVFLRSSSSSNNQQGMGSKGSHEDDPCRFVAGQVWHRGKRFTQYEEEQDDGSCEREGIPEHHTSLLPYEHGFRSSFREQSQVTTSLY